MSRALLALLLLLAGPLAAQQCPMGMIGDERLDADPAFRKSVQTACQKEALRAYGSHYASKNHMHDMDYTSFNNAMMRLAEVESSVDKDDEVPTWAKKRPVPPDLEPGKAPDENTDLHVFRQRMRPLMEMDMMDPATYAAPPGGSSAGAGSPRRKSRPQAPGLLDVGKTIEKEAAFPSGQPTGKAGLAGLVSAFGAWEGISANPKAPAADLKQAAQAVNEGGLTDKAETLIDKAAAVAKGPGDPGAPKAADYSGLGRGYLESGDNDSARRVLDRAVRLEPDNAEALSLRAQTRLASGDREGALEDARRSLKTDPGNALAKLILGHEDELSRAGSRRLGEPRFGAADAGSSPEGSGLASAAAGGRAPEGAAPRSGIYTGLPASPAQAALLQKIRAKLALGDLTGALLEASRAIDSDPKNAAAWALRAEISNRLKNWAGALKDAGQALALDPDNPAALRERGYAQLQLGNFSAALADLDRAVALDPGNGLGHLYRAMALEKLGRLAEAAQEYRKAAELDASLAPLAEEALKRLGAAASAARVPAPARRFYYGGIGALALALILLGLLGTERGRELTTTARGLLAGRAAAPPAREETAVERPELGPGAMIGGHFQIIRELGRGGMGVVFEAEDLVLQRRVAAKQLQADGRAPQDELARFISEARLVAKLKHPNLAEIYSVVEEPELFLVFELVSGRPLDRELKERGTLPPSEARAALAQICAALDYAHSQRIIHRDLKPSNVMRGPDGACKVMDFGIAHQAQGAGAFTRTAGAGTPPYMAPEQTLGSVSKASDFFALAVMTYEMLAGRRPYAGPDFLDQKLRQEFAPVTRSRPGLPPGLDAFFARALAADPTKRHQSGAEFLAGLDAALG